MKARNAACLPWLKRAAPDYLTTQARLRVEKGPLKFNRLLQVAEPGDTLDDPSIAWPDTRKLLELGTLTVTTAMMNVDAQKTCCSSRTP